MKNLIVLTGFVLMLTFAIGNAQGHSGWGVKNLPPPNADSCCFCHWHIDVGPGNSPDCKDYTPQPEASTNKK